MKLLLKRDTLYANGVFMCFAEVNHGSGESLQSGRYALSTSFSHTHGRDLVLAHDGGWVGGDPECAVVLCSVRGRNRPIPCLAAERRFFFAVESAEERGEAVTLVIEDE